MTLFCLLKSEFWQSIVIQRCGKTMVIVAADGNDNGEAILTAIRNDLLNEFQALDETKQQIFWFYYLNLFTDGNVGGNLELCGSVFHYKITSVWTNTISPGQFTYRAKKLRPLVERFHEHDLRPTGNIPIFLVPLDGGKRPTVVTLDTLRWVRNTRNPQPNELWE